MPDAVGSWELESFLDSLILELDKAQDTLSVKGLTRKLTYTVKDVSVDLHVFPRYEQGHLRFAVARPGEEGASRIAFQLGSITDRQITETTNEPISTEDVTIEEVEGLDREVKDELKRIGVTSARDVERLERRNIDLGAVVERKTGGRTQVDYSDLASRINNARRGKHAPRVDGLSVEPASDGRLAVTLSGSNLAPLERHDAFPVAVVNDNETRIVEANDARMIIEVDEDVLVSGSNTLSVALDPFAMLKLDLERKAVP